MFTSKSVLLQVLCLLPMGSAWHYHGFDSYVPFPEEATSALESTVQALKDQAPKVIQILTFPGKDFNPHMQEVAVRNSYQNPLFMYEVDYMISDGLQMGCRTPKSGGNTTNSVGRVTDHVEASKNKDMCKKHCIHNGRYCTAHAMSHMEGQAQTGHNAMMETLRRICLGNTLENSYANPIWFDYLENFRSKDCMAASTDLNACSKGIMEFNLEDFPSGEGSDYAKCVDDANSEGSKAIPALEAALDFAHQQKKYVLHELPVMEIGEHKFSSSPRTDHVLAAWCGHFTGEVRPIGCDFCEHCSNQKNCLWNLNCDGHLFDATNYKDPIHNGTPDSGGSTPASTTPAETPASTPATTPVSTGGILAGGMFMGFAIAAVLWLGVEHMRKKKALAEGAKAATRYSDNTNEIA